MLKDHFRGIYRRALSTGFLIVAASALLAASAAAETRDPLAAGFTLSPGQTITFQSTITQEPTYPAFNPDSDQLVLIPKAQYIAAPFPQSPPGPLTITVSPDRFSFVGEEQTSGTNTYTVTLSLSTAAVPGGTYCGLVETRELDSETGQTFGRSYQSLCVFVPLTPTEPTTPEDCKKKGYERFPGSKNQGQCVRLVAGGDKNEQN